MLKLKIKQCLRLDHTFKVASNIGYLLADGKWITQYSSIFIVLNEIGEVVAWQLTNSTSIDEVAQILSSVKERISEDQLIKIYEYNCCHVRKKLEHIFGSRAIVKLDVFHAVQRITRAMSKKNSFFHECIKDLRMVFRHPIDIGTKRTMPTPESSPMLQNLDNFVAKWRDVESNSQKILTNKVMKQIMSLRTHTECGCLSNIDPSGGTNYNEALHRHINPHFSHAGRMGLQLVYALLTLLLYSHNCKKANILNSLPQLIASKTSKKHVHSCMPQSPSTSFGIVSKNTYQSLLPDSHSSATLVDDSLTIMEQNKDSLVKKALYLAKLADDTQKLVGKSPLFSYHVMPFMTYVPSLHMHCSTSSQQSEEQAHYQRLTNILTSCNMCRHDIAGNGNCCFATVSFSLLCNLLQSDDQRRLFLHQKGIKVGMSILEMAKILRQLAVKEWTENSHHYAPFFTNVNIAEEAIKFLNTAHFKGDLGDTVLMCLANILETPIIVFSSMSYHPIFCITPEIQRISLPLLVAYNQYGGGHFDGMVPKEPVDSTVVKSISCTCGKNDKSAKEHCCEVKHKYTSQIKCACLINNRGCTENCKCKNCNNILGKKVHLATTTRRRSKHVWQHHQYSTSVSYANIMQERLASGPLTKQEYFLLESIMNHCRKHDIEVNTYTLGDLYSNIITSINDPDVQVKAKSLKEIENYLKSRNNILKTFKELCNMQMRCVTDVDSAIKKHNECIPVIPANELTSPLTDQLLLVNEGTNKMPTEINPTLARENTNSHLNPMYSSDWQLETINIPTISFLPDNGDNKSPLTSKPLTKETNPPSILSSTEETAAVPSQTLFLPADGDIPFSFLRLLSESKTKE